MRGEPGIRRFSTARVRIPDFDRITENTPLKYRTIAQCKISLVQKYQRAHKSAGIVDLRRAARLTAFAVERSGRHHNPSGGKLLFQTGKGKTFREFIPKRPLNEFV